MSLRSSFGIDDDAVKDGVWVEGARTDDDRPMEFLITFMSATANPAYEKITTALMKPYRRMGASIPDETVRQVAMKAFVRVVLKGWRNVVVDKGGEDLEYSQEKADWLMKELPMLYDFLATQAADQSLFKNVVTDEGNEDAAKNSNQPSSTNLNSGIPTAPKAS